MANATVHSIDRPAPGHYQGRLAAVLSRQALRGPVVDPEPIDHPRRRVRAVSRRRRRCGQLALW